MDEVTLESNWTGLVLQWLLLFALLAIIFFIGLLFGRLAAKFGKHRAFYIIVGVLIYLMGVSLGIQIRYAVKFAFKPESVFYRLPDLLGMATGLCMCVAAYLFLKGYWKNQRRKGIH